jgi:hypothetical protein
MMKPARAVRDISTDKTAPIEDSAAGQRPAARGNDDVEHGGRNERTIPSNRIHPSRDG